MEILQTIWAALTTENEMLSTILLMPETFLEIFIQVLLFTTMLSIKSTVKSKFYYIVTFSIITNILNVIIDNPFRSIINLIIMFTCIKIFFRTNIIKTFLSIIIPIIISVLCESIIIKLITPIIPLNLNIIVTIPIYRLIFTLLVQVSLFLIYLSIKFSKIQISNLENMSKRTKIIFILNFALAIVSIIIQFILSGFYVGNLPLYIVIFSNISLIAYFVLSIYSLIKTTQLEVTSLNLEQEKENNRILTDLQDDLRGFRHDFSNIMCTISGYVQVNDMEGLSKYYSEIQKDITKVNNLGALNPDTINNPAIFTLIASKYRKALENGIEMNIKVFLDLNTLNMKIYEFTRILGILLDNSIEAAKKCNEKIINLEIRNDEKRNRQILILENTYNNKKIDTEKIFEKNFSTKEKNSGLGLWEVRQILRKNKNLNLYTSKTNKYFSQQLEMYNI